MTNNILKQISLLYVEDDENVREIFTRGLKRKVKNLYVATNGQEGFEKYQEHNPDIIVTDIKMPIMSGLEMTRKIREVDNYIPIIITSANGEVDIFLEAIELNVNGYVLKPIDKNKLFNAIQTNTKVILFEKEMEKSNSEMRYKAYHDPLTKIYNRAKLNDRLEFALNRFDRYDDIFCIAIIDIDHFKSFNDTYGHLIGDEILISLAQVCDNCTRTTDTFARWGGEEFIVLLSNTDIKNSITAIKNLQQAIATIEHKKAGKITASFGIAQVKQNDTIDTIFKRADSALYKAKQNGRDRYEIGE